MTKLEFEKVLEIINDEEFSKVSKNETLQRIFSKYNYKDMIATFNDTLSDKILRRSTPVNWFMFFLSLSTQKTVDKEELTELIVHSGQLKNVFIGAKIMFAGKSKKMKFEYPFRNSDQISYRFYQRNVNSIPIYQYKHLINLLSTLYEIDNSEFIELLREDNTNFLLFLFFSDYSYFNYSDDLLIEFLNSSELKISRPAFIKLMNPFFDIRPAFRIEDKEKELNEITAHIGRVLHKVKVENCIELLFECIVAEDVYPKVFSLLLTYEESYQVLIKKLNEHEFKFSSNLQRIVFCLTTDEAKRHPELNACVAEKIIDLLSSYDSHIIFEEMESMIQRLDTSVVEVIYTYLDNYISSSFISEFDRQVRYVRYQKESSRLELIQNLSIISKQVLSNRKSAI